MGAPLGKLTRSGKLTPPDPSVPNPVVAGGWVVAFQPAEIGIRVACEVYRIAVKGPPGSRFEVWVDTTFVDNVKRGDVNSWDPSQPLPLDPGATVFFYYNTGAGAAPKATLFFREPSPI